MGMVVPMSPSAKQGTAPVAQLSQTDLLMALAEMHRQGRFDQPQQSSEGSTFKDNMNAVKDATAHTNSNVIWRQRLEKSGSPYSTEKDLRIDNSKQAKFLQVGEAD